MRVGVRYSVVRVPEHFEVVEYDIDDREVHSWRFASEETAKLFQADMSSEQ